MSANLTRSIFVVTSLWMIPAGAEAQPCLIPQNQLVSGGPGKDGIPALTTPWVVSAGEGDSFLQAEDLVLGVVVNGEARAYPHAVLWWHEIVNDVLGGKPILVTFCPLTGSGIVYDPEIDGRAHNFGVSGLLFDNNLIMFDRTTDSLWSQMRLQSICGSFLGTRPRLLPVVQASWAGWKSLHPETTVVSFDTGFRRNYDVYPYGSYDQIGNEQLLFPQSFLDRRLPMKETVLGIVHDGLARAYSMTRMAALAPRLAVNDVVNRLPVLVAFDSSSSMAIPFDRRLLSVDGAEVRETLELDVVEDSGALFRLKDRQTGSLWSLTGVSVEGPLQGERLRQIETYSAFRFAWAAFNRDSEIHDPAAP